MSGEWHCKQLPNGDNPIIVCEREQLMAEIEQLRSAVADRDATIEALREDYRDALESEGLEVPSWLSS